MLINKDFRAQKYVQLISEINKEKLQTIPALKDEIILNVIGNHSK